MPKINTTNFNGEHMKRELQRVGFTNLSECARDCGFSDTYVSDAIRQGYVRTSAFELIVLKYSLDREYILQPDPPSPELLEAKLDERVTDYFDKSLAKLDAIIERLDKLIVLNNKTAEEQYGAIFKPVYNALKAFKNSGQPERRIDGTIKP